MAAFAPSDRLRQLVDSLPLDPAPLRRAGLLTVLLIGLLVLGRAFAPSSAAESDRQDVQGATEEVSVPRSSSAWTGGRVLAILFLVTGGGIAFWLHRRSNGQSVASGSTLKVLESHSLGPGQSLRLMACGQEVLLLSVASEGTTLLRHWPRERFDADEPTSFASTLASLSEDATKVGANNSQQTPSPTLRSSEDKSEQTLTDPTARASELASPDAAPADARQQPVRDTPATPLSTTTRTHTSSSPPTASPVRTAAVLDDERVASAPDPTVHARGSLFPARGRAPRQFDVHHE